MGKMTEHSRYNIVPVRFSDADMAVIREKRPDDTSMSTYLRALIMVGIKMVDLPAPPIAGTETRL